MAGELLTGYLLGGIGERGRQDMRRAARAAAGIASDQGLVAEVRRLRAELAEVAAASRANHASALSWRAYAAELEAVLQAHGLMA